MEADSNQVIEWRWTSYEMNRQFPMEWSKLLLHRILYVHIFLQTTWVAIAVVDIRSCTHTDQLLDSIHLRICQTYKAWSKIYVFHIIPSIDPTKNVFEYKWFSWPRYHMRSVTVLRLSPVPSCLWTSSYHSVCAYPLNLIYTPRIFFL